MDNQIDDNLHEMVTHGTLSFPFVIYKKAFHTDGLNYISTHWHNEIEILYCNEGELLYTTSNEAFTLNQDNFIVVNQNMLHQADMIGEASWYAILFDPKMIYGFEESACKNILGSIKFKHILLSDKYLIMKIKSLINLYFKPKTFLYELLVKQAILDIYIEVLKLVSINIDQSTIKETTNQIKIHQMLEYIYKNYKQKISIEDIGHYAGLCRSDACKFFKDALKTSIADYVIKLRIEKSINLLLSDNMAVAEIAAATGFRSASYYSEAFRKIIGLTPLEYKKKNKR